MCLSAQLLDHLRRQPWPIALPQYRLDLPVATDDGIEVDLPGHGLCARLPTSDL